jgi:3-hydroxyisobutyrate dehydrogenase-like beta-hydroxyacid dehydrogenase
MAENTQQIGWIGVGRMGYQMAERPLKAGHDHGGDARNVAAAHGPYHD